MSRWWQRGRRRGLALGVTSVVLAAGGGVAVGVAIASQHHAPQPTAAQAGVLGPAASTRTASPAAGGAGRAPSAATAAGTGSAATGSSATTSGSGPTTPTGPTLAESDPVAIDIPAIGVDSPLLQVGLNSNGTIQVPPLFQKPSRAAWYKYSPTPGQIGPSIIEGHIDTYQGPSVFFRLGAIRPGQKVYVTLQDGTVAVFKVDGVREYPKSHFPTHAVYGNTNFAALRLLTCGGSFDSSTRQYLSNTVVYTQLVSSHPRSQGVVAGASA